MSDAPVEGDGQNQNNSVDATDPAASSTEAQMTENPQPNDSATDNTTEEAIVSEINDQQVSDGAEGESGAVQGESEPPAGGEGETSGENEQVADVTGEAEKGESDAKADQGEGEPVAEGETTAAPEDEAKPAAEGQVTADAEDEAEPAAEVTAAPGDETEPATEGEVTTAPEAEGEAVVTEAGGETTVAEVEGEGEVEAAADGIAEGETEAAADGKAEGEAEAAADGIAEGEAEAAADGKAEGEAEAAADGKAEGVAEAAADGKAEGEAVEGENEVAAATEGEAEGADESEVAATGEGEGEATVEGEDEVAAGGESEAKATEGEEQDKTASEGAGEAIAVDNEVEDTEMHRDGPEGEIEASDVLKSETLPAADSSSSIVRGKTDNETSEYLDTAEAQAADLMMAVTDDVIGGDNFMDSEMKLDADNQPPTPPPVVETVTEEEVELPPTALHPVWSFGLNRHVPVINLSNPGRSWIFYACAHLGIIYDINSNKQTVLQGHSNAISCTAASADKRWLVTGDKGEDSLIVIWDSMTGMPVRSMFEPHPNGVVAVALTPDARYLATLSAETLQTFAIWDWTTGDELPLCSASLSPEYRLQNYIMFNASDVSHVVTNSESQVLFYCWKGGRLEYFAPPLTDKDFNKPVGKYSNSIFLTESTRALTATSQGLIVMWDSNTPLIKVSQEATPDKKAVKLVPMHERGINVLTSTGNLIVTGDTAGVVKFFDQSLQLVYWYQNFTFGPINSLSFAHNVELISEEESMKTRYPNDCTIPSSRFIVRDFVLGTSTAVFATVSVNGTIVNVVHRDHDAPVHALAAHPTGPRILVGGYSGLLKVWNYQLKKPEVSRYFDRGNQIRCCSYDPNGIYIALGFVNGVVRILDALTLLDVTSEPFHYSREEVTHLAFSSDSTLLATADGEYTTTLYRRGHSEDEDNWVYVGRHRAHYKAICDILFGLHLDNGQPRLLTLGKDRFLVEYDIANSSKDNLPIAQKDRIEQSACPHCMTWYPSITKEQFLCISNDQFKLKLYNTTTKMCRKTLLGPTFGSPINKCCVLAHPNALPEDRRYLAYIINDKVGLVILPLDGNPHNAMCLVAHPGGVTNLATSFDGRYIFTAGGTDTTVHMWAVHTTVLDAQALLGGDDLTPFYGLLEGGQDGQLFAELEDYFYYAQLRSQGINTMDSRSVSTHIPISEVPFVMRALGFYPTEQEIEDMMNEIKFSRYVDTGEYVTQIDLAGFIRLFVNHRPAFGLDMTRISWAFEKLGLSSGSKVPDIDRMDLLDILQTRGEHMSEYELAEYITTLLGCNPEGGSCELEEFDPSTAGDIIETNLPNLLNAELFTRDILSLGTLAPATPPAPTEKLSVSKQTTEVQTID